MTFASIQKNQSARGRPALKAVPSVLAAPVAPVMRKAAACACGGGCPRCKNKVQPKLKVSQPGDSFEREADDVAEHIMRAPVGTGSLAQTGPAISRKADASASAAPAPAAVSNVLRASGQPLDRATRGFFEPRFGRDLSGVRVHTGTTAAQSAYAVSALAYTTGKHVVFGAGRYAPGTPAGNRLLAHELTHVLQQSGQAGAIQRTVDPARVHCQPNVHNAPDDPVAALRSIDQLARDMASGGANAIFLEAALFRDPRFGGQTDIYGYYRYRFGEPPAVSGGFRNRYTGEVRPTLQEAAAEELMEISERMTRIYRYLSGVMTYQCAGVNQTLHLGNCAPGRCLESDTSVDVARSCAAQAGRELALCPTFWDNTMEEEALTVIHEAIHMLFHVQGHGLSPNGRMRNPECLSGFIAHLFGISTPSTQCPPVTGAVHPIPTPF
jgi:hypothetical protein